MTTKKDEQEISEYVSNFLEKTEKKDWLYGEILHNLWNWRKSIYYIYQQFLVGRLRICPKELESHNICAFNTAYRYLSELERYGYLKRLEGRYKSYEIINIAEWKKLIQMIKEEWKKNNR